MLRVGMTNIFYDDNTDIVMVNSMGHGSKVR